MTLPAILGAVSGVPSGYTVGHSLRFRASATAYLNRTPASAGNRQTWTWSGWVKRGALGTLQHLFSEWQYGGGNNNQHRIFFGTDDRLTFMYYDGPSNTYIAAKTPAMVFRDPSAWYHVFCVWDTTNATASDRLKVFVNGTRQTTFNSTNGAGGGGDINPSQNTNGLINLAELHTIGSFYNPSYGAPFSLFDGYLAEVNFIDGQALTPSSFGSTDPITGVWVPAKYTGTYGTNGFYLPFSDNTSATTLAYDKSGNGNNWTANNISTTAGATYDSMTDVPTLTSATASNCCVWNPNFRFPGVGGGSAIAGTFSDGNLKVTTGGNATQFAGTMPLCDGAYYEVTAVSIDSSRSYIGLFSVGLSSLVTSSGATAYNGTYAVLYSSDGTIYVNTSSGSTPFGTFSAWTNGDVISIAYKSGKIYIAKNNVWQNSGVPASGTGYVASGWDAYGDLLAYAGFNSTYTANFGQQPFTYTPPTGFVALNTFNLPDPTIKAGNQYMDATLWTGNGSTQTITNSGSMAPDFVWIKARSIAVDHQLADTIRGATKTLNSNATAAEQTIATGLTAFNSNGFSLGAQSDYNNNGSTYVGWQWKAGGTAVSNTAGSITSQVSANTTAGFSVVTYTGNGSSGATVGHGLGVAPKMTIIKQRNSANAWNVWAYANNSGDPDSFAELNSAAAWYQNQGANGPYTVTPSSTVLTLTAYGQVNGSSNTYVAYCFAEIAGYSKFGSYTGNGSTDGSFVFLGFRPRYIMFKRTDTAGFGWQILDTARNTYNTASNALYANLSDSEGNTSPYSLVDILSNGFKHRQDGYLNQGGATYIYAAFAENPFKYSLAR